MQAALFRRKEAGISLRFALAAEHARMRAYNLAEAAAAAAVYGSELRIVDAESDIAQFDGISKRPRKTRARTWMAGSGSSSDSWTSPGRSWLTSFFPNARTPRAGSLAALVQNATLKGAMEHANPADLNQ